jgi:hypothetical protein
MQLYQYANYDEYVAAQVAANKAKVGKIVYVQEQTINSVCRYHTSKMLVLNNILCHGTRDGTEQKFFKAAAPSAQYIIGSEISDNAHNYPMTIQHDFNKIEESWIGKFDVIYSNSFDHSITPYETIKVWMNQLNSNGRLYIEWSDTQNNGGVIESDPLNASIREVETMIVMGGGIVESKFEGGKHNGMIIVARKIL